MARYENVFCIFMAGLAYLARGNPDLVYPDVLYLLVLLLGLNLAVASILRLWPSRRLAAAAAAMANCAVVAGIVEKSGGGESLLWVLYLLPIYTAGLLLRERELWLVALGGGGLCLLPALLPGAEGGVPWFAGAVKTAVLLGAAGALARASRRERSLRVELARRRGRAEMLESALAAKERRLAEAAARAGTEIDAAAVLHDARTPLTVIAASAAMAQEGAGPDQAAHLSRIQRAARMCEHILVGALDAARQAAPARERRDVCEVLEAAVALREPELRMRGIEVRRERVGDVPPVSIDDLRMERVFLDIISNALQAMGPGGVLSLRTEPVAGPGERPVSVRVSVEDTGPGLPEGALARGETTKPGGCGLGLKASQRAVALQNGSLWAENKPGGGARFVMELPAAA